MIEIATCPQCGQPAVGQGRFCASCGADIRPPASDVSDEGAADRLFIDSLRRATIGEYEIREELGRGGMATVFLAQDLRLRKKVAIKVLSPQLHRVPGMATRFLREAQTAAGMEHPNIIPIYAYRETADFAFFTMRYVDGASLSAVAKQVQKFPIPTVRALLWDIGGALSCAHAQGVLHRDVKPGNVLLGRDGAVVVTDFGIAKRADGDSLTMTGQLLGTPAYMSPEQCRGVDISFASDQYSLGVMAYELLAGRAPFNSYGAGELMAQHLMEPAPHIHTFRPDCPADLAASVMRMLAKHPAERYASIDEALHAARAVPLLPSDPARLQIRAWAENPVHARSLADTPLSPLVGSLKPASSPPEIVAAPTPVVPTPVAPTLVVTPPVSPVQTVATPESSSKVGTSRWLLFSPAVVAVLVSTWLLLRERPKAPPPPPPPASVVARGTLQVEQLPDRGQVFVDGTLVQGARVEVDTGARRVRIEAPGFVVLDTTLNVAMDSTSTLVFAAAKLPAAPPPRKPEIAGPDKPVVKPSTGVLVVSGLPAGGRTFVDGRPRAGSRLELEPGRRTVRLQAAGFVSVESVVQISAGTTGTLVFASTRIEPPARSAAPSAAPSVAPSAAASPAPPPVTPPVSSGVLMLRVTPFARVFVDGAFKSEDNKWVLPMTEGRHVIRFEKPGYAPLEATVTVTAGDTLKKSYTIQAVSP